MLGYPSRVRLHGIDPSQREADVMYIKTGCADAPRLLDSYEPDFLVVGPAERGAYAVNDRFISQFPLVGAAGGHELRRIRDRPIAVR